MKLRLDEQSVRLRLGQVDIETLTTQGSVKTTTPLPGGNLEYGIENRSDIEKIECVLSGSSFWVLLPAAQSDKWVKSDQVGIYASITVGNDQKTVEITLEKDLPCKHGDARQ